MGVTSKNHVDWAILFCMCTNYEYVRRSSSGSPGPLSACGLMAVLDDLKTYGYKP